MKFSRRKKIGFSALIVLLVSLCSLPYLWQKFYYDGPKAAFYQLASALEEGDKTRLKRLTSDGVEAEFHELDKPYGGIRNFGKYLRQSPKVSSAIHMVATVDVFATVQEREIMFMFTRRQGRWVAVTVFFTGRAI